MGCCVWEIFGHKEILLSCLLFAQRAYCTVLQYVVQVYKMHAVQYGNISSVWWVARTVLGVTSKKPQRPRSDDCECDPFPQNTNRNWVAPEPKT